MKKNYLLMRILFVSVVCCACTNVLFTSCEQEYMEDMEKSIAISKQKEKKMHTLAKRKMAKAAEITHPYVCFIKGGTFNGLYNDSIISVNFNLVWDTVLYESFYPRLAYMDVEYDHSKYSVYSYKPTWSLHEITLNIEHEINIVNLRKNSNQVIRNNYEVVLDTFPVDASN